MLKLLFQKISIAIISTIILSWILSLYFGYTPNAQETVDTAHFSYSTLFIIYAVYSLVIYTTLGVIISWIIEVKIKKQLHQILLYTASGAIIGGVFYLYTSAVRYFHELMTYIIIGVFASLLFLVIQKVCHLTVFKLIK
ncbi:hypothetical protein [Lysinibacillus sphaericus]|uniref:hypothetical protein n=1 Tax=Lysinibacillus sphaericus TaxID=1421 RepID=UPI003CFC7F76